MAHWFSTRLRWGVTRRLWCAVVAVALVVGLAGVTVAQADDDHDQARAALRAGEVLPLQTVLNRIATAYPGRVLANAARDANSDELRALVAEQVPLAQRHIHWHMVRSRAAATTHVPGQRAEIAPAVQGLLRVMTKVHADKPIDACMQGVDPHAAFAGEAQDLQEMLGNLLDNAWRHARSRVSVATHPTPEGLCLTVDDDGPGIPPNEHTKVLQRGVRLDETQPGTGLGLAIVVDLAQLYGGNVALATSPTHGLRVSLALPSAT
jgi:signal transduction histidine kinase